jgi:3-hydroxyisobutyrate dehydrogenase-like beta-hydroxyacid dehydrogenase
MKVGFIGLGHMGAGMAANLLRAGHTVTVYNRTPGKAQALVEQGAHVADTVGTMLAPHADRIGGREGLKRP